MKSLKILGESAVIKDMLKLIERVAGAKTNILIIGESGTGKELVARMIHDSGPLAGRPFVPVNCGAIPENLIESEMFGHRKGSFTGAVSDKMGLFEVANTGTLFLDEVGELPLAMQVKLLRAIQERSFRRVGGTEDVRVDLRIIAATNRDLEAAVAKNTFREDLYYRLNVIQIRTPPLRERRGDVRLLAEKFLKRCEARFKSCPKGFSPEAMAALESYDWPGNVRELENVVERAVTLDQTGALITPEALPASVGVGPRRVTGPAQPAADGKVGVITLPAPDFSKGPVPLDQILADVERTYLNAALEHAKGVKKKAAALLGITFRSVRYRLTKLGIDPGRDGDESDDE